MISKHIMQEPPIDGETSREASSQMDTFLKAHLSFIAFTVSLHA